MPNIIFAMLFGYYTQKCHSENVWPVIFWIVGLRIKTGFFILAPAQAYGYPCKPEQELRWKKLVLILNPTICPLNIAKKSKKYSQNLSRGVQNHGWALAKQSESWFIFRYALLRVSIPLGFAFAQWTFEFSCAQ